MITSLLLLVLGLVLVGLGLVFHATESHAYADGTAPTSVRVHPGKTYLISVPGGVKALAKHADVSAPQCSYQLVGSAGAAPLDVTPETATNATNAVGSFVSPVDGQISIDCLGWGPVYVDDSDDAGFDVSTALLVLGSVVLLAGVVVGASSLARDGSAPRDGDEVERLVDVGAYRRPEVEVGPPDTDDVGDQPR
jgi:hypothetical protein